MVDQRQTRWRWTAALAAGAIAALAAACSSGASTSTTSPGAGAGSTSTSAASPATVQVASKATVGKVLVATNGFTLYTLSSEKNGQIMCTGSCAAVWKPLTVPSGQQPTLSSRVAGSLGTVRRPEGTTQVTYEGHPLYFFAGDTKKADAKGQGIEHVWYVVSVGGAGAGSTSSTSGATTTTYAGY